LPEKIIAAGDPYVEQLKHTADLIAEAANIQNYTILNLPYALVVLHMGLLLQ
jgi:protoheme ferro-lyase